MYHKGLESTNITPSLSEASDSMAIWRIRDHDIAEVDVGAPLIVLDI